MAYSKARRLADIVVDTNGNINVPTQSASDNDTSAASTAYVTTAVANVETSLIDSAPDTLNTLNEIAAALNDDANFNTTVTNSIAAKLPLGGGTMTGNIAHASDFTLDIGGDLTLDADGGDIKISDGGTQYGLIANSSTDLIVQSTVSDKDIIFRGNDGGSTVVAMTLDMSEAGKAIFNAGGLFGSHTRVNGDFSVSASSGEDRFAILPQSTGSGTILMSGNEALTGYEPLTADFEDLRLRTSGTERMRIDTSGRMGIGMTPSDYSGYMLQMTGGSQSFIAIGNDTTGTGALNGLIVGNDSTGADIYQRENQPLRLHTNNLERIRIDASGNVGIGLTNPAHKLQVNGNVMLSVADGFMYLSNIGVGNSGIYVRGIGGSNTLRSHSTGVFRWEVNGSEKMMLGSDGKLGIGTTSPTYTLDVAGDIGVNEYIYHNDDTNTYMRFQADSWLVRAGGDDRIFVDGTNGRVGIGTNSPTKELDVRGGSGSGTISHAVFTGTAGRGLEIRSRSDTAGGQHSGTAEINAQDTESNGGQLAFSTGGTIRAFLNHTGLGINETDPDKKLHITDTGGNHMRIAYDGSYYWDIGRQASDGRLSFTDVSGGEVFTLTTGGNIGIGTASPAKLGLTGSSAGKVLQLSGDDAQIRITNTVLHHDNSGNTTTHLRNHYGATSSLARMKFESGYISFCTGTTFDEKMRLKGNTLYVSTDIGSHSGGSVNGNSYAHNTYAHAAVFGANSTPDGTVVIEDYDVSSGIGNTVLKCYLRDQDPATLANFIVFGDGGGQVGSITHKDDGSGVNFNTSSDYRLKENVEYNWDATTLLKQLKPAKFNFIKAPGKTVQGFLAHEVSNIVPGSVKGDKDHMMEIGTIKDSNDEIVYEGVYEHFCKTDEGQTWTKTGTEPLYQQLDYSKIVPLLVKTIQELEARIETLEG